MLFNIHLANIDQNVAQMPGFEDAGFDRQAVLEECARLNEGRDRAAELGRRQEPSAGTTAWSSATPRLQASLPAVREGGWQGLQHPTDFGGQGLPKTIGRRLWRNVKSANMSSSRCARC